ncbi:MAG: GrpB family protein [Alphaproteobacteria bacterium]
MSETLEEKIKRVTQEEVAITAYNSDWIKLFEEEKKHLIDCLPKELLIRIEHFGSTSVQGLAAKPIVDMVIEITDELLGKEIIPQILEPQGYDCFWRPLGNENVPPFFTWCIKRNEAGVRTHHLHFVTKGFKDDELKFRDILRANPETANDYANLKKSLASKFKDNRIKYTESKGDFIREVMSSYKD